MNITDVTIIDDIEVRDVYIEPTPEEIADVGLYMLTCTWSQVWPALSLWVPFISLTNIFD